MERIVLQSEHDFLHKLEELVKSGVKPDNIETRTPHPVHHAEDILRMKPSNVRLFVLMIEARMPAVRTIISNDEFSDSFEIYVKKD